MAEPTFNKAQTAHVLSCRLGFMREWYSCLQDMARNRQTVHGLTLRPAARKRDDKSMRPFYRVKDIEDFIAGVQAVDPSAKPEPIKPTLLDLDPRYPWLVQKFDRDGKRVKRRITCRRHRVGFVRH